jgi:hypothetical protein
MGKMLELIHEGDTLSSLLAEQEAVEGVRKSSKYVDVGSVKSMQARLTMSEKRACRAALPKLFGTSCLFG